MDPTTTRPGLWRPDPRLLQVAFLASFLVWLVTCRDFVLAPWALAAAIASVLVTQRVFVRALRLADPGPLSPLISALSLGLLLRTNDVWVAGLAGFLAIASKFTLRYRGKHVFNPTNFGIIAVILLTDRAWVSPAQWGSAPVLAFLLGALGVAVAGRSSRLDTSLAFLAAFATLQLGRVLWLGHAPEVFAHRMTSGALVLFAFFMISDPRSTPDARAARILFSALVAVVSYVLQFRYFVPVAPLWALVLVSPVTPLLDRLFAGRRFAWNEKGVSDAQPPGLAAARRSAPRRGRDV